MLKKKTSHASITAGLSDMVTQLETHAATQQDQNAADEARKIEIDKQIAARDVEINKSTITASKIKELIG